MAAGLISCGTVAWAGGPNDVADLSKSGSPAAVLSPNPSLPLRKGMLAQEVRERWGEPAATAPYPSADGKAAVWTYYYTINDQTTQVVTSTVDQMTYCGPTEGMRNRPRLVYGMKRTVVNQVVRLLLYDGTLISWKKSIERTNRLN